MSALEPIVRVLSVQPGTTFDDALGGAQAAFVLQVPPYRPEIWELPAGTHALATWPVVGAAGRDLTLTGVAGVGQPGVVINLASGGVALSGASIAVSNVALYPQSPGVALAVDASVAADLQGLLVAAGSTSVTAPSITIAGSYCEVGLTLQGAAVDARALVVENGTVTAVGAKLTFAGITIAGHDRPIGLDLHGDVIELTSAQVSFDTGHGAAARTGILLSGTTSVVATDVRLQGLDGQSVIGVEACAPTVRLASVTVDGLTQAGAVLQTGIDGIDTIGVVVEAATSLEVTHASVTNVHGDVAVGLRAVCTGDGTAGGGGAFLADALVEGVQGVTVALGVLAITSGPLQLRGFSAIDLYSARSEGVVALAGSGLDVTVGHIDRVRGTLGVCSGARLLGTPSVAPITVSDLTITAVGRRLAGEAGALAVVRPTNASPPPAWEVWARNTVGLLAGDPNPLLRYQDDAVAQFTTATRVRAGQVVLPARPSDPDIAGLHVGARVDDFEATPLAGLPGTLRVDDVTLQRLAGTALQLEAGLRALELQRVDAYTSVLGGWVQGEQVLAAELTWHLHGTGLRFGPSEVRLFDAIFSGVASGPSCPLDQDAEIVAAQAVFITTTDLADDPRFSPLGALPYADPGAGALPGTLAFGEVPLADSVDLQIVAGALLRLKAVPVPGDESAPFVGAIPPVQPPVCELRDPEPRPLAARRPPVDPSPAVDYTARDARGLLALMLDRATVSMPAWTDQGPADFTTMLFEVLADRLDLLAYAQERATNEGFLALARLRRSVEDHARALDCVPDPGLSATTMLRFELNPSAGLTEIDGTVLIPANTLVGSTVRDDVSVVFATETPLTLVPGLDRLRLAEDCQAGSIAARLKVVAAIGQLTVGRWVVLVQAPHLPGLVVRVTAVEPAVDTVLIRWDPRRPAPIRYTAGDTGAVVHANVVAAHHGVPLTALRGGQTASADRLLGRYRDILSLQVDGDVQREVELPMAPVSVLAPGYPLPGDEGRAGVPALQVAVEGDAWTRVDDLALAGAGDEVYVLRSAEDGRGVIRFGDGVCGAALPAHVVTIELDLTVGRGTGGNVGAGRLTQLIQLGRTNDEETALETRLRTVALTPTAPALDDLLRVMLTCDNPLPAVGGRDPEPLDRLRYRAPLMSRHAESAITTADYEALLMRMPEVAAARAIAVVGGIQPLVKVTVLLRDEDTLDPDERLRRWALVRRRLEEIRLLGFDVESTPPRWVPLDLDVVIDAAAHAGAGALQDAVVEAVAGVGGLLDPDRSGLGGDVHLSQLYQTLLAVPGVTGARVKRFRRFEPSPRERLGDGVIPIEPDEVAVIRAPQRAGIEGLITVTVCGGLR